MRIRSPLFLLLLFTIACTQGQQLGTNGENPPGNGGDAAMGDAALTDTSPLSSSDGGTAPDVAASPDAGAPNSLAGKLAFSVAYSLMYPTEAASQCHANVLPDGSYDAISVLLTSANISAPACSDAGASFPTNFTLVDIEIAGLGYGNNSTTPEALAPGVYPIGNEGVPDDDLCMLEVKPGALLDVRTYEADAGHALTAAQGLSGIVTLTRISPTSIAGSFTATMIDFDLASEATIPNSDSSFTGTFDTTLCPGVTP